MHDIFISYSRKNLAEVKRIMDELEGLGFSCWMDLSGIPCGTESFISRITPAIQDARLCFLFFLSTESQTSKYAMQEIGFAKNYAQKKVVLVRINDDRLEPHFYFLYQYADIIDWRVPEQKKKLLADLWRWNEDAGETGNAKPVPPAPAGTVFSASHSPAPAAPAAPVAKQCEKCGRWRPLTEVFECRKCGKVFCTDHQDRETWWCEDCAAENRKMREEAAIREREEKMRREREESERLCRRGEDAYWGRGVLQSYEEAVECFHRAADMGNAAAQFYLGMCVQNGQGAERSDTEALKWYRKAAEQGHAGAQCSLGVMCANGRGVKLSYEEAAKWFRMAAEQGNAHAQYNLGVMYDNGQGVRQSDMEALKWYWKAAEQGYADAQYNLGVMYDNGQGVGQSDVEAAKWYRKAAEQGCADAQYSLGLCCDMGRGVQRSRAEALKWYRKAAEQRTETIVLPGGAEMEMVWCPPGTFVMGSPEKEGKDGGIRCYDERQHLVTLTKGFWLAKYPVTQTQWNSVMGYNPSHFEGGDHPVEKVSWAEVQGFCLKAGLRLPTEAEWEYACRAGTTGPFAGTGRMEDMGWCRKNGGNGTHPVGQKIPNAWGLYDMHGNVWEWCADGYEEYPKHEVTDPSSEGTSGGRKVYRGGSWYSLANKCRSANRGSNLLDREDNLGFRPAAESLP